MFEKHSNITENFQKIPKKLQIFTENTTKHSIIGGNIQIFIENIIIGKHENIEINKIRKNIQKLSIFLLKHQFILEKNSQFQSFQDQRTKTGRCSPAPITPFHFSSL